MEKNTIGSTVIQQSHLERETDRWTDRWTDHIPLPLYTHAGKNFFLQKFSTIFATTLPHFVRSLRLQNDKKQSEYFKT
jgi:hypothetical protein